MKEPRQASRHEQPHPHDESRGVGRCTWPIQVPETVPMARTPHVGTAADEIDQEVKQLTERLADHSATPRS